MLTFKIKDMEKMGVYKYGTGEFLGVFLSISESASGSQKLWYAQLDGFVTWTHLEHVLVKIIE